MVDFDPIIDVIYFFGDNVGPDGNDYCLYKYPDVKGYHVNSYHHTIELLTTVFPDIRIQKIDILNN